MNESLSVLIVDDSPSIRSHLREIVTTMGHGVLEAANGREGLELCDRESPDIILTDLEMPEMDGLAFTSDLRKYYPTTPVIVVSRKSSYEDVIGAVRSGAWDYLVKPVRTDDLEVVINRTLERARLFDESYRYRTELEERVHIQTRELVESSQRYRRLLESVTSYVYTVMFLPDGSLKTIHRPGCLQVTGYTVEEYQENPDLWYKIVHADDRPQVLAISQRILSESETLRLEHRIVHKNGSLRWIRNTLVPCRDSEEILLSYDGIIADITEQKLAEERITESERKFKTLFEVCQDGLLLADVETRLFRLNNQAMSRMLGFSAAEFREMTVSDIHPPESLSYVTAQFERQVRGELDVATDIPVRRKDGTLFFADISANYIQLGDKQYLLGSFRDVSERKATQDKLKRHMENLTALRAIDNAINGSLDLRITLRVLLIEALKQLTIDAAAVLLMNPSTQTLEYASGEGFRTNHIQSACVRIGESCSGRVARERRTLVITDFSFAEEGSILKSIMDHDGVRSYVGVPLIAKGVLKGVLGLYHRKELHPEQEWFIFVEALASQAAIAIDNAELFESLQASHSELLAAYDTTIEGWSRALDFRDKETEGHSRRVTDLTVCIAREMGLTTEKLIHVRRGALLHDIGKLGVPDSILLKPGALTDEEFTIMKRHPEIAFKLLSPIEFLRPALDIPYYHHERWNGNGYPQGLCAEEIPLTARIFSIVDVWDALCSDRPYRSSWPPKKAMTYLRDQAGKAFDPRVVELFLAIISKDTFRPP
jgi:PAS domain S-box-containing protein